MASTSWKVEKDLCRCCHSDGAFHSLSETCPEDEKERVYSDILRDCLDIEIAPVPGDLCIVTFTICEACVLRLRDVNNFKKQVLMCEEKFKDHYSKNFIKVLDESLQIKIEPVDSELKADFSYDDDDGYEVKSDSDETAEFNASILESALRKKGKSKAKQKKEEKKPRKAKKIKQEENDATPEQKKRRGIKLEDDKATKISLPNKTEIEIPLTNTLQRRNKYDMYDKCKILDKHGRVLYVCQYCSAFFKVKYSLKSHIENKHIKCDVCHIKLESVKDKLEHLDREHAMTLRGTNMIGSRKFECDHCDVVFYERKKIMNHLKTRHRRCDQCNQIFDNSNMLAIHSHTVHGKPIPTCGVCGYKSESWWKVSKHQRKVHLRERTIPCHQCDLKFYNQSLLAQHAVKHSGRKDFECTHCHKTFCKRATLNLHMKIHTGEKTKVCPVCGEKFVQKASLNYHMSKYHPGVPVPCVNQNSSYIQQIVTGVAEHIGLTKNTSDAVPAVITEAGSTD